MSHLVVFRAITLDDPASLHITDVQTVVLPHLVAALEVGCTRDMKVRSKVPFPNSLEGVQCFTWWSLLFPLTKRRSPSFTPRGKMRH
jgi:hypothetical protein